jgi:hypothetical protein
MKGVMFITVAGLLVWAGAAHAESRPVKGELRNASGKLLYKTKTQGGRTEVRDPSGKLLMKMKTKDGRTEVRSPSGKLLRQFKSP